MNCLQTQQLTKNLQTWLCRCTPTSPAHTMTQNESHKVCEVFGLHPSCNPFSSPCMSSWHIHYPTQCQDQQDQTFHHTTVCRGVWVHGPFVSGRRRSTRPANIAHASKQELCDENRALRPDIDPDSRADQVVHRCIAIDTWMA